MRKIVSTHVILTLDCNFRCKYCFVSHKPRYMTEFTLMKTMEFLANPEICTESFRVEYFGGEPLMVPDMLFKSVDYLKELAAQKGMKPGIGIVSNMFLATPDVLDKIKERNIGILASFDGDYSQNETRHPNSADTVKKHIKLAVEKGINIMVAMQVVPGQTRKLYTNFRSIEDLGIREVALNPVVHGFERGYDDADWRELERQFGMICDYIFEQKMSGVKRPFIWTQLDGQLQAIQQVAMTGKNNHNGDWSCGGCKGSIAVDPEGYIVPCHQMPSNDGYDQWNMGHVSVPSSFNQTVRNEFCKTKFEDCSECAVLRCAPCRTVNKSITGIEFERAPQSCQYQRLMFEHAVRLHNRLADAGYYSKTKVGG